MKKVLIALQARLFWVSTTFVCALTGCGSAWYARQDIKKLDGLSIRYPTELARLSNKLNPCFTTKAKSDTVIKQTTDTVVNTIERLVTGQPGKPDTLYLPGKTIRIKLNTTIHDTVADNRALRASFEISKVATDSLLVIKSQNVQYRIDRNNLIKWIIGLAVALISAVVISIYKFFSGGFITSAVQKLL